MINMVPITSLKRFMLATVISLPAFVKGKTQMAQQKVPANAINIPTDVICFGCFAFYARLRSASTLINKIFKNNFIRPNPFLFPDNLKDSLKIYFV